MVEEEVLQEKSSDKEVSGALSDIKKHLDDGKLVIGADRVVKLLKQGSLKKVLMASNCSEIVKSDVENYAKIGDVVLVALPQQNSDVGALCKKPFAISVLGISK